jgi:hypothetical protein
MYLLMRYQGGIIVEGVVLAKGKNRLRVVAAGFPDTIEIKRADARWLTSRGELVEIEFLMSDRCAAMTAPSREVRAAAAAGLPYLT